ncbi:hypothetical protein RHDC1_01093 [Rhodocyclaceae bacterium]|nr:hypothetical protein RHDC1_01093 [Rhodocyclaceae bacterium]
MFSSLAHFDFSDAALCCLYTCFGQLLRFLFGSQTLARQLRGMLFGLQFLRFNLCGLRFGIGMQPGCSSRFLRKPQGSFRRLAGARFHRNTFILGFYRLLFCCLACFEFGDGTLRCLCAFIGQLLGLLLDRQTLTRQLRGTLFGLQFLRFDLCRLRLGLGMQLGCGNRLLGEFHSGGCCVTGACFHGDAPIVGFDRLLFGGLACFDFGDGTLCCLCAFFGQLPGLLLRGQTLTFHCSGMRFGL